MHWIYICCLLLAAHLFGSANREERRVRFEQRSRYFEEVSPSLLDHLEGFFLFGNVGGAGLSAFDTQFSYENRGLVVSDAQFTPRSSFHPFWNVGIGWFFYGYASLDASYQSIELPFSFYAHPIRSASLELTFPQQGYGNVQSQLITLNGKLLLPKILGMQQSYIAPFIGAGLGYVHQRLSPLSFYGNTPEIAQDQTERRTQGSFAYKILAGWYFFLQEQILMNVEWNYLHMGSVDTTKNFSRTVGQNPAEELSFLEVPRVKVRAHAGSLGFTWII
ncbi:MAG: hypothetical protein AAGF04_02620 [Chlamydiota bacterium]